MKQPRERRVARHIRSNLIGYVALAVALTMTPLPADAGHLVVRTSDIVNGAVTKPKIRDGAVTRSKIRDGAVTAAKLRDGAVTRAKLGDLAVGGPNLGPILVITTKEPANTAPGGAATATATCQQGTRVIGGGFDADHAGWRVDRSTQVGNGWNVIGTNLSGQNSALQAVALCLM